MFELIDSTDAGQRDHGIGGKHPAGGLQVLGEGAGAAGVGVERAEVFRSPPPAGRPATADESPRAAKEAVLSLAGPQATGAEGAGRNQPPMGPFVGRLAPIHPGPASEEETADLRYVAGGPRGYVRVLGGMVRANRPWRLVPRLSKVLAAALATGAIATVNSTVWSMTAPLSTPRLLIAMVGSVALMIGWLIVDAHLWHRSTDTPPEERRGTSLYNASTVVTVGIGVLVCYVGLMVINLVWVLFILNDQVFSSLTRTSLHTTEY